MCFDPLPVLYLTLYLLCVLPFSVLYPLRPTLYLLCVPPFTCSLSTLYLLHVQPWYPTQEMLKLSEPLPNQLGIMVEQSLDFYPQIHLTDILSQIFHYIYVTGSGKTRHFWQTKKNEFFMLIKSYNLSQLSAKILEGKTFDSHRNWQLNWDVFSKAIELEIVKT